MVCSSMTGASTRGITLGRDGTGTNEGSGGGPAAEHVGLFTPFVQQ